MTRFTVNLSVNDAFYSYFSCKFMHFTVYLTAKLHKSLTVILQSFITVHGVETELEVPFIAFTPSIQNQELR